MQKIWQYILMFVVLVLVMIGAYSYREYTASDFCRFLDGSKFVSLNQYGMGFNAEGIIQGNSSVLFEDGQWIWYHSDMGEFGPYTCKDGKIIAERRSTLGGNVSATIDVSYEVNTGILSWEGIEYTPES